MKRIFKSGTYKVEKYTETECMDMGTWSGDDVHAIIKGCTYDEAMGMYFNKSATIGYTVTEA